MTSIRLRTSLQLQTDSRQTPTEFTQYVPTGESKGIVREESIYMPNFGRFPPTPSFELIN